MPRRPVKQSPLLDQVESKMSRIGTGTFLGSDPRKLSEILNDDQDAVSSLGLSHKEIAARLEEISKPAKEEMGDMVRIEGRYEVQASEARGLIPCPWSHPGGLFQKSHVTLRDVETGKTLVWTDLSVHLIRDHGFYQGRGSPYRMEPEIIKEVLFKEKWLETLRGE